jgi:hypothetical protein
MVGRHIKVAIHSLSLSLSLSLLGSYHVSTLKQQSNAYPTRMESVLPELACPCQLELSSHTRVLSPYVLQVPLRFGKHPFTHAYLCLLQLSVRLCANLVLQAGGC